MPYKKKLYYVLFCIVLVSIVLLTGCTSNNPQPATQSASAATTVTPSLVQISSPPTTLQTAITTQVPTTSLTSVQITTTTEANNPVSISVNSVQLKSQIGTFAPKTGNIFLLVDLTIKNTDPSNSFEYSASSFTLNDKSAQKTYSPITSQLAGSLNNPLSSGQVPFKSQTTGQIVFGILNTGALRYKLTITDSTGNQIFSQIINAT